MRKTMTTKKAPPTKKAPEAPPRPPEAPRRVVFTLALDAELCDALDELARAQLVSRSALIRRALASTVGMLPMRLGELRPR